MSAWLYTLVGIVTMLFLIILWSRKDDSKERLDNLLLIGQNKIDLVSDRLLMSPEYRTRCYSGRLDVLKNETRELLKPLHKNLTCEECKFLRRGLGYHIAKRAKKQ